MFEERPVFGCSDRLIRCGGRSLKPTTLRLARSRPVTELMSSGSSRVSPAGSCFKVREGADVLPERAIELAHPNWRRPSTVMFSLAQRHVPHQRVAPRACLLLRLVT